MMRPMFPQFISDGIYQSPFYKTNHASIPHGNDVFFGSPSSPLPHFPMRTNPAFFISPDLKLFELNKRLSQRTEDCDIIWWDKFATEFFDDISSLTICLFLDEGRSQYTICRRSIPRFLRSLFDGGVVELSFQFKNPKEFWHNKNVIAEYDQCTMISHHQDKRLIESLEIYLTHEADAQQLKDQINNNRCIVYTQGRLVLEFSPDMRIKSWHFTVHNHQELVSRNLMAQSVLKESAFVENLTKNLTCKGFTEETLNLLKMCVILEPMQEIMSRHKTSPRILPRDCLRGLLLQRLKQPTPAPVPVQEVQLKTSKRRHRKSNTNNNNVGSTIIKRRNICLSPSAFLPKNLSPQDVMIVTEPSLMGGEFCDEDERFITRLENTRFEPSSGGGSLVNYDDVEDLTTLGAPDTPNSGYSMKPSNNNNSAASSDSWSNIGGIDGPVSGSISSNSNEIYGNVLPGTQDDEIF